MEFVTENNRIITIRDDIYSEYVDEGDTVIIHEAVSANGNLETGIFSLYNEVLPESNKKIHYSYARRLR
ncbi:MAG: hypothetical protein ACOCZ5_01660 [bacterium]